MLTAEALCAKIQEYDPQVDVAYIKQAYTFSRKAHAAQTRASGEPYFTHPLEVAEILINLKLDFASIMTGLLHDTVEDTLTTLDEIRVLFGKEVAFLVDGVTKLSHLENLSDQAKQKEQFRKLLMATASDIRVLLVKLADRLHNMRTLHFVPSTTKRQRVARETLDIFVPLAERIGLRMIKEELEDLCFQELNPDARHSILSRLKFLRTQDENLVPLMCAELDNLLKRHAIEAHVLGREKAPYSIWQKMQRDHLSFEQIADIVAFRILVDEPSTCYQVLGLLHSAYPIVPGRFKDYISLPKKNNYRSIHTTLIGPFQRRVEIQIRTRDMEKIASLGIAAHWGYKQGFHPDTAQYQWIRELLDLVENASHPEDFLEHTRLDLFQDQVFCFTPKGDLITLPKKATPIDFAYAVHSRIGNTCVGSKINGRLMPLKTRLQNGDQVDIMVSNIQTPSPLWEHFVVTPKAKSNIRRFIRQKKREEFISLGRSMLDTVFQEGGMTLQEHELHDVYTKFHAETVEDLLVQIGDSRLNARTFFYQLHPDRAPKEGDTSDLKHTPSKIPLPIEGLIPGMALHYASCCHPLPGDGITGLVLPGEGIQIHTKDCEYLKAVNAHPECLLDVSWRRGTQTNQLYVGRIALNLVNQPGTLATLTTLIAKSGANILNLKINSRHADFFELFIDLEVHNAQEIQEMVASLKMSSWVLCVERLGAIS